MALDILSLVLSKTASDVLVFEKPMSKAIGLQLWSKMALDILVFNLE